MNKRKANDLCRFFIKFLLQPLIHQGLNVNAALSGLLLYLVPQFEMDAHGGNDVKVSVGRVGIKLSEVVTLPELANLLIRIGFRNAAYSIFCHSRYRSRFCNGFLLIRSDQYPGRLCRLATATIRISDSKIW